MERRSLGRTGLTVSALGFGCGNVGGLMVRGEPAERREVVARALDAGITYFDTAPSYGNGLSEQHLGEALRDLGAWERVVVGTKVRLRPEELADPAAAIRDSVENSLRRLGRDAVDLLQLHNPVAGTEPHSPAAIGLRQVTGEVVAGMRLMVERGLVRHVGFTGLGDPVALRDAVVTDAFATIQAYFNALNPSAGYAGASGGGLDFAGLIDVAAQAGLGVIVIRALAAGALGAAAERHPLAGGPGGALVEGGEYPADVARARALAEHVAAAGAESLPELALRFALAKPGVSTVLAGVSDREHLETAIRAAERGPLPEDVVQRIVAMATYPPDPLP